MDITANKIPFHQPDIEFAYFERWELDALDRTDKCGCTDLVDKSASIDNSAEQP